jgi:hypothetical protein
MLGHRGLHVRHLLGHCGHWVVANVDIQKRKQAAKQEVLNTRQKLRLANANHVLLIHFNALLPQTDKQNKQRNKKTLGSGFEYSDLCTLGIDTSLSMTLVS